jgi:outer membrane protein
MPGRTLISVFGLWLAVWLAAPAAMAADLKIAYVDMEKAFTTCSAGKTAKSVFTRKLEDLTRRIEAREGELSRMRDELEKSSATLSADARSEKEDVYRQKYRDYQRLVKDSQEDLRREDSELTNKIVSTLLEVVERVGRSRGYTLVLEKKSVLYAAQQIEITNEVVEEMDKLPNPVTSTKK